jgi:hypothetical protein
METVLTTWLNQAHSVEAPIASLFCMVHPRRRAADAQGWQGSECALNMNGKTNRLSPLIHANRISGDERRLAVGVLAAGMASPVQSSADEPAPADGGSGTCLHSRRQRPGATQRERWAALA